MGRKRIEIKYGDKNNSLTFIKELETIDGVRFGWFKCNCNKEVRTSVGNFIRGTKKSCGCKRIEAVRLKIEKDQRFGRLIILNEEPVHIKPSGQHSRRFKLKCDCGNEIVTSLNSLRSGNTKSCGCYMKEINSKIHKIHGESHSNGKRNYTPTYQSWRCMRDRCLYSGNIRYQHYGGRGIKICDRWNDFRNFLEDMGDRPEGLTLDRFPNKDGDYTPDNCRWATDSEQMKNRRPWLRKKNPNQLQLILD